MGSQLLNKLWDQYVQFNPHVQDVYNLFVEAGEKPTNDHIALRTIDDPRVDIYKLAQPFINEGYSEAGSYDFEAKKLKAIHLEPLNPNDPKVFISQLLISKLSHNVQKNMRDCIDAIPETLLNDPQTLLTSGASWKKISHKTYKSLLEESEYAAWFYVFGYRANHFTIFINQLKNFQEVIEVNEFLKSNGIELNTSGGEIKGSVSDLLEQSSTVSGMTEVDFIEGKFTIPCCYFEFAKRYPDDTGILYQGFVAKSADKIFESTNVKS